MLDRNDKFVLPKNYLLAFPINLVIIFLVWDIGNAYLFIICALLSRSEVSHFCLAASGFSALRASGPSALELLKPLSLRNA